MLRAALAVIAGYLAAIATMFVLFAGLWLILGAQGSYEPGTWVLSQKWLVANIAIELVAGICAGLICALIAKSSRPPNVLALFFLAFGVLNVLMMMKAGVQDLGARPDDVGMFAAMQKHQDPIWLGWMHPVLGITGVLIGARLRKKS